MKLIHRQGNNRTYQTDKGNIEIVVCLDRNLYVRPGYYVRISYKYPDEVMATAYSSGKRAAMAAYNSMA